jgi:hypothetical protein
MSVQGSVFSIKFARRHSRQTKPDGMAIAVVGTAELGSDSIETRRLHSSRLLARRLST